MKKPILLIAIFSLVPISYANAEETPHLQFVSEYIRELGATEHIRDVAKEDLKEKGQEATACVKNNTSFQLELQSEIAILNAMQMNSPFETLIGDIIKFYKQKIGIYEDYNGICSAFIAGPKEGVDYQRMAAEMPKLRAKLEFIDQALFEASGAIAATLIDMRGDSQNHASHLVITKEERQKLIHDIDIKFADKLKQKNQNFTVSSASVIKDILLDHECSDDPWE